MNRHPAGTTQGGQFASAECPRTYAMLDTLPLGELDVTVTRIGEGCIISSDTKGRYYSIAGSTRRCRHGHFVRYARKSCKACKAGER
jgi:hypothetical protein